MVTFTPLQPPSTPPAAALPVIAAEAKVITYKSFFLGQHIELTFESLYTVADYRQYTVRSTAGDVVVLEWVTQQIHGYICTPPAAFDSSRSSFASNSSRSQSYYI